MKNTIVVDTHNLLYRSHYAYPSLMHDGTATGAMHGVLMALHHHRVQHPKSEIIFVWDGPPNEAGYRSWRYQVYDKYKADRRTPETDGNVAQVVAQVQPLYDILHYAGYLQYRIPGIEADDMIGLTVSRLQNKEHRVLIDSTDKDFYQLLGYGSNVLIMRKGGVKFGPADLFTKYGVTPAQWVGYRALMGDPSDGIPGMSRCGPVGAQKLMNLGAIPNDPWDLQPDKVRQQVAESRWEHVPLWHRLSCIITRPTDPLLVLDIKGTGRERTARERIFRNNLLRHNPPASREGKFVEALTEYNLAFARARCRGLLAVTEGE